MEQHEKELQVAAAPSWLADGLKAVQVLATEADKAEFVRRPGDPPQIVHLRHCGTMTRQEVDPPNRLLDLLRIDDLISLGREHFDAGVAAAKRMAVFFDCRGAVLIFDTRNGYEQAVVRFVSSQEHDYLEDCLEQRSIPVSELRDELRIKLAKALPTAKLIEQIAALDSDRTERGTAAVGAGRESIGRSIVSQVVNPAGMPDPIQTFMVRRWANADLPERYPVVVLLEPNARELSWLLAVQQDGWQDYQDKALEYVERRLRGGLDGTGIPIYQGAWDTTE
jgi:hypothetical protein